MNMHPFANASAVVSQQYYFASSLIAAPVAIKQSNPESRSRRPLPAAPRDVQRMPSTSSEQAQTRTRRKRPTGTFVRSDGRFKVTLYGQQEGCSTPSYDRGSVFDGDIFISQPESVLKLEANLQGFVNVKEVAAGGSTKVNLLSETLVYWDDQQQSCPPKLPFQALLPSHYSDELGRRNVLPPTFSDRLTGIPGFKCSVDYVLRVTIEHSRSRNNMWRKNTVIQIPIIYRPRSRPAWSSPLPANTKKGRSKPATLFVSIIEPRSMLFTPIITNLYLPHSQICPMNTNMPFYIKITGSEHSLFLFTACMESQTSFLPFSGSDSILNFPRPNKSLVQALSMTKPNIRVSLIRQVAVDAGNAKLCILNSDTKSKMYKNTVVGEGKLGRATRTSDSIIWTGEIEPLVELSCGGFSAANLSVQDAIVFSVESSDPASHNTLVSFRQVVPVRLTTDAYGSREVVKVSEVF